MNEPHDMNGAWRKAAQAGLDAIRSIGPQRLVLVPGDHWTGAWKLVVDVSYQDFHKKSVRSPTNSHRGAIAPEPTWLVPQRSTFMCDIILSVACPPWEDRMAIDIRRREFIVVLGGAADEACPTLRPMSVD
jgi:hypothetical protein